jgi:hypothetical protein
MESKKMVKMDWCVKLKYTFYESPASRAFGYIRSW